MKGAFLCRDQGGVTRQRIVHVKESESRGHARRPKVAETSADARSCSHCGCTHRGPQVKQFLQFRDMERAKSRRYCAVVDMATGAIAGGHVEGRGGQLAAGA